MHYLLRLLPIIALAPTLAAEVALSPLFGDHAVLQAGDGTAVWGTAAEGEQVTVRVAGVEASTVAAQGRWLVRLKGLKPEVTGKDLVVQGTNTVTSHDVLVGEVWLAGGQSNMERQLGPRPPQKLIEDYEKEAAAANYPGIRYFVVPNTPQAAPTTTLKGSWQVVTPSTILPCSAVGYFFARALHEARHDSVGLVVCAAGGSTAQGWISRETLLATAGLEKIVSDYDAAVEKFAKDDADWTSNGPKRTEAEAAAKAAGKPAPRAPGNPQTHYKAAITRFNGMLSPVLPLTMRGVIWYQGESNNSDPAQYEVLMPALITEWRTRFANPTLPFLTVQVAPFKGLSPEIREAQERVARSVPHAGIVTTIDIGDAEDIHPTRKRPVGERLAVLARQQVYGETGLIASGPCFAGVSFDGAKAVVRFTELGGGLVAPAEGLKGFTLAGADGKFVEAQAVIAGDTMVVTAAGISAPTAVRYAWANAPVATLANRAGLPAFPFRSDRGKDRLER